jgi:hypothetical protein
MPNNSKKREDTIVKEKVSLESRQKKWRYWWSRCLLEIHDRPYLSGTMVEIRWCGGSGPWVPMF